MSVRLMTKVWDSGEYSGGTLLVLLALCDWANDHGTKLFPYLETLAGKARLSVKQTRRTLETLIADGVVEDIGKTGITKAEILDLRLNLSHLAFRDKMSRDAPDVPEQGQTRPESGTFVPKRGTKVPPYIDEPSSDPSREPSSNPSSGTALAVVPDLTDIDRAVFAFNEAAVRCPKWTPASSITSGRRKIIAARLKEVGLDGWREAVAKAEASGFLGGDVPTTGDHVNWRMDINWFAKAEKFTKIYEGGFAPGRKGPGPSKAMDSMARGIMTGLAKH